MISLLVIMVTFAAGFLAVFGANLVLLDLAQSERKKLRKRMDEELLRRSRKRAREQTKQRVDLGDLASEAMAETSEGPRGPYDWLVTLVEQSGLNLTVGRLVTYAVCSAGLMALLALAVCRIPLVAAVVGLLAGGVPILIVHLKRNARIELMLSQLPDTFDLMARILRAGQSMPQAMDAVSKEFKPPVALEFAYCYEQQNLGLAPEIALRDLARRTGLLEVKIFVLALLVHQQTGGNLAEVLENLAHIVRDRFRIRGMIKSLTAEGRVQAGILLALPPFMYCVVLFINRDYALRLFENPALPITALAFMFIGAVWIRKIVNFDF